MAAIFNRLMFWNRPAKVVPPEDTVEYRLATKLTDYERAISEVEKVIMWDDPLKAMLFLVFMNLFFWGFVSLEFRFIGIVCTIALVISAQEAWTGHFWPEIRALRHDHELVVGSPSPRARAVSEKLVKLHADLKNVVAELQNLRNHHPGVFCCSFVILFSGLFLLARTVSGLALVYSLLMMTMIGPGLYTHCVPASLKSIVAQQFTLVKTFFNSAANDASDDEYLPNTNSEDLMLLTRASDMQITDPATSSDIASGIEVMPSHDEDSLASISDLEPAMSFPLDHDSADSNLDEHNIQFQTGHFNGDSSSDEEAFAKDLMISEEDEKDAAAARGLSILAQAVKSNISNSMGMIAGMIKHRRAARSPVVPRMEADSDLDDFVVIRREDLKS